MSPSHSYQAYHRATHTVGKTRQVVMLYDGAIRFLQQARDAMEKKEIEKRYKKLTRVSEIVMGLQSCLDFDMGGSAARVLYDFYSSVDSRIITLHRTNDAAACLALIDELKTMREVWYKIDRGEDNSQPEDSSGLQNVTVSA